MFQKQISNLLELVLQMQIVFSFVSGLKKKTYTYRKRRAFGVNFK